MIDPKTLFPLTRKRVLITTKRGGKERKIRALLWWIRENKVIFTPLDAGPRCTWRLEWIISIEPLHNEIVTTISPASLKHAIGKDIIVTYGDGVHASRGMGTLRRVDSKRLYQSTPSKEGIRVIPLPLILQVEVIA